MFNLFRHEITSRWIAILGWGIGLALFASMYIAIYPSIAEEMAGLAGIQIYQAMGIDLASFAGYIASVVVQIIPIILGVYVIMVGTGTLAGEDDNGTLELVVAMPLKRWQIVAMKAAALAVVLFLIIVIMGLGSALTLTLVKQTTEVDVTAGQLFVALLGAYPMQLAFFCMGLFLGTITPNRRVAVAIMALIYIGSYLANSLSNLTESLEGLETISLFAYVNTSASVFEEGLDPNNLLILVAVALIFFLLALWGFQQRNITVGQWFWQRGRVPAN